MRARGFVLVLLLACLAAAQTTVSNTKVRFLTDPSQVAVFQVVPDSSELAYLGRAGQMVELPGQYKVIRVKFGFAWRGRPVYYDSNEYAVPVLEAAQRQIYPLDGSRVAVPLPFRFRMLYELDRLKFWMMSLGSAMFGLVFLWRWQRPRQQRRREDADRLRRLQALTVSIESSDPRLMSKVGGYRLTKRLGRGGMATVYKGLPEDNLDEKQAVAIKLIKPEEAASKEYRARFMREVEVCSKLLHSNIVKVMDSGDQDGQLYIVMELIAGDTLRGRIGPNGMPLKEVRKLCEPVFSAIQYAHENGVVHRDLKPDNIMVTGASRVVVMDFGLAKRHDFSTVTASGSFLGTPAYMAPEQMQSNSWEASCDQYSLGVMLYEMLTGHLPFLASDPVQLIVKHLHEPPIPPRKHNPRLPAEVEVVVLRMLEKDPQQRYADVAMAWEALHRAIPN